MYKCFIHKYLIIEAIIYLIYITIIIYAGLDIVFFGPGALSYITLQVIISLMLSSEFKKKGDFIIKERYPDLYERYMGREHDSIRKTFSYMPARKDDIRPIPAAQFLLFDKKLTVQQLSDEDIINMRKDAKLYYICSLLYILPFVLLFVGFWVLLAVIIWKTLI